MIPTVPAGKGQSVYLKQKIWQTGGTCEHRGPDLFSASYRNKKYNLVSFLDF